MVDPCAGNKKDDKGEPRELAGEPNTAAVGFLVFAWRHGRQ